MTHINELIYLAHARYILIPCAGAEDVKGRLGRKEEKKSVPIFNLGLSYGSPSNKTRTFGSTGEFHSHSFAFNYSIRS